MKDQMKLWKTRLVELWKKTCVQAEKLWTACKDRSVKLAKQVKPMCQRGRDAISRGWNWLAVHSRDLWDKILIVSGKAIQCIRRSISNLLRILKPKLKQAWQAVRSFFVMLWQKLSGLYAKVAARLAEKKKKSVKAIPQPAVKEPEKTIPAVAEMPAEEKAVAAVPVEMPEITAPSVAPAAVSESGKVWNILRKVGRILCDTIKWIWKLRGLLLSAPVAVVAIKLAFDNIKRLPEQVGLDIQASGEFAHTVSRELAVLGPLAVTAFCILLTVGSKKPLFPWVISVFSLVLPLLIWILNYYA